MSELFSIFISAFSAEKFSRSLILYFPSLSSNPVIARLLAPPPQLGQKAYPERVSGVLERLYEKKLHKILMIWTNQYHIRFF